MTIDERISIKRTSYLFLILTILAFSPFILFFVSKFIFKSTLIIWVFLLIVVIVLSVVIFLIIASPQIDKDGNKRWFNNKGQRHRIDGPAIEYANGDKEWYLNGKRHRTDGPALEKSNGDKEWWQHGLRHRIDGPAIELADGTKQWYLNGIKINPNIKINHNICQRCKTKCHNGPRLVNIPIECKYELEHIVSNDDQSNNR